MSKLPWPKLSETLPHERHPWVCQSCGLNLFGTLTPPHQIWREHDHQDKPTRTVVILCEKCSARLIEPHPRLYHHEPLNKPVPGAMPHLCVGCVHSLDLDCDHPLLRANGGPGLNIKVAEASRGFWDGRGKDGRRTGGMFETWPTPATACAGAEPGKARNAPKPG